MGGTLDNGLWFRLFGFLKQIKMHGSDQFSEEHTIDHAQESWHQYYPLFPTYGFKSNYLLPIALPLLTYLKLHTMVSFCAET